MKIRLVARFLEISEYIRSCNDTQTKIDEIDTLFKTKPSENHALSGRTYPLTDGHTREYPSVDRDRSGRMWNAGFGIKKGRARGCYFNRRIWDETLKIPLLEAG